jgi:hypothetical protein
MPKYVIAYLGGRPLENPQERTAHMDRWKAWVDALGSAMIDPGTPLGQGKLVSSAGISERGPNRLTGFSILSANDISAVLKIAQQCPFLDIGTIEVAQVMEMR